MRKLKKDSTIFSFSKEMQITYEKPYNIEKDTIIICKVLLDNLKSKISKRIKEDYNTTQEDTYHIMNCLKILDKRINGKESSKSEIFDFSLSKVLAKDTCINKGNITLELYNFIQKLMLDGVTKPTFKCECRPRKPCGCNVLSRTLYDDFYDYFELTKGRNKRNVAYRQMFVYLLNNHFWFRHGIISKPMKYHRTTIVFSIKSCRNEILCNESHHNELANRIMIFINNYIDKLKENTSKIYDNLLFDTTLTNY